MKVISGFQKDSPETIGFGRSLSKSHIRLVKKDMIKTLKKAVLFAFMATSALAIFPQQAFANDLRTAKVARFLASQGSPLVFAAPSFVMEADKHDFDYRLLVAISGVESTFGKHYIPGTYNVWGWGVGRIPFLSFEDGITRISADLKNKYIDRGASDIDKIARIYCPPTHESWAAKVKFFMEKIEATDVSDLLVYSNDTPITLKLTL